MSRTERFVNWLLRLLRRERFEIGRAGSPYLTRWTLLGRRFEGKHRLFLHLFHRGDNDEALHDHPWAFWSFIIWPGYFEETPLGTFWRGPFSLLKRPAEWRHRVKLLPGSRCWTLVWTGPKERSWYFHCPAGPVHWREFVDREDAGRLGCG